MKLFEIQTRLRDEIESFPYLKQNFKYDSSPLKFQTKSGIKVCQYYKMPENIPVEEVYRYYSSILSALDRRKIKKNEANARIQRLTSSVLSLNPDLAAIQNPEILNAEGHVLIAALSLFPIEDIKSYVVEGKTNRWYISQPDWSQRYKMQAEIENLTGAPIHWVMSNSTLNRVYNEVVKKYK